MADIIRAGALWGYCPLTRFLAHDPKPLLEDVGLNEAELDNTDNYLPRLSVSALMERSAVALDCSDFGFRLAGVQDINILGALAFAIRNAPDLRSAGVTAARHVHYHSPTASLTMGPSEHPGETAIIMRREGSRVALHEPQTLEHATALFCRVMKHLSGGLVKPTRVQFTHAPVSSSDVYAEHLGVVPTFAADSHCVSFGNADLAMPLKGANKHLKALVERYLELNTPSPGDNPERRVHQAVAQLMRHGPVNIEDVCDLLNMHPRTLQRRLAEDGVTFEKVRDSVRKEMAEAYLTNPLVPLAHVAHVLGYANQSVLTRSCLRWFGRTPLAMRQHMLGMSR